MTIASALVVVTVRNIVHAAFSLMVTLFGVAGLYVFLQADFLAATQVIVYVGGILVLILFGVMMTSGRFEMPIQVKSGMERGQLLLGGVIALGTADVALNRYCEYTRMEESHRRWHTAATDNRTDWRIDPEWAISPAV